jgi:hypothetical protein
MSWGTAVYFLCFLTSASCAFLLVRSYLQNRSKLLLWSAVCFVFLSLNNLVLVLDLVFFPDVNFGLTRPLLSFAAVTTILYGFIWELD